VLQENRLCFFIGTNEKNIDSIRGIERKLNVHLVMFHNNWTVFKNISICGLQLLYWHSIKIIENNSIKLPIEISEFKK